MKKVNFVFEDSSLAPTTVCTDNPNNIIIENLLTTKRFDIIVVLLNKNTLDFVLDFVIGTLSDKFLADNTREVVCGIQMETFFFTECSGCCKVRVCDSFFAL